MPEFDAIVLAGGRGSRLGGISKADLVLGGRRLLDVVLASVAGARTTVVVGDVAVPDGVVTTLEDPPGGGPAAGLVAGLGAVEGAADWTVVLACDLPGAEAAVPLLLAAARNGDGTTADGFCLAADDGTPQWLLSIYRSASLRAAADDYGDPRNRSVRGLVAGLDLVAVADPTGVGRDVDTPADREHWAARSGGGAPEDRSGWEEFVERACAALDVERSLVDLDGVLDMTREVAHAGARPMAPVSAFLLGLAVGNVARRGERPDVEYLIRVVEDAATAAPVPPGRRGHESDPVFRRRR